MILPALNNASADNYKALERLYAVFPVWQRVVAAQEVFDLPPYTLLHAGPPFNDPRIPSKPILSSASLCAVYEGWSTTASHAEKMIRAGQIKLISAQQYGAVVPLASLISPSATLVEVADATNPNGKKCWSELTTGPGAMLRFGTRDTQVLERMRFREKWLAPRMAKILEKGVIPLFPHALKGIQRGDDLHSSTTEATASLTHLLHQLSLEETLKNEVISLLNETPLFFLTLWMASCQLMLGAMAKQNELSTLVIALAGNGQQCGIKISGSPLKWRTVTAGKPAGKITDNDVVSGVIGDSGCIDAAGFGAQLGLSKRLDEDAKPANARPVQAAPWGIGQHPFFSPFLPRCAIDISAIPHSSVLPHIAIAMLDENGEKGLLGKGLYKTEKALYQPAIE